MYMYNVCLMYVYFDLLMYMYTMHVSTSTHRLVHEDVDERVVEDRRLGDQRRRQEDLLTEGEHFAADPDQTEDGVRRPRHDEPAHHRVRLSKHFLLELGSGR